MKSTNVRISLPGKAGADNYEIDHLEGQEAKDLAFDNWAQKRFMNRREVEFTRFKEELKASKEPIIDIIVECDCMGCGKLFDGPEPKICCSGGDCSCMGLPIDPVVCSSKCRDIIVEKHKTLYSKGEIVE